MPAAPRSVSRLTSWHHRFARTALPRAGLGRMTETTQDAFHQLGPWPCGRGRRLMRERIRPRFRPLAPIRVLRWTPAVVRRRESSASRYPAGSWTSCDARVRERGGCSSPTSATDPTSRAPAMTARFPVFLPARAVDCLLGRTPRGMPGRVTLDGAPRASIDSAHAPADPAVAGAPDFLVGSDIGEPSKGRPPFRGVVFRGRRVRIDL